ncbi:MAG: DUF4363 family protein [Clostridia bacterium]
MVEKMKNVDNLLRISIVIILLITILACGIVEQIYIAKTFDRLEELSVDIYNRLQKKDFASALAETQTMIKWWEKQRDILEFLCPNSDIKEIIREMSELEGSQLAAMYDDSVTRANVLKVMAKNSKNLLAYNWKNVL